jgi:hypothetical protein
MQGYLQNGSSGEEQRAPFQFGENPASRIQYPFVHLSIIAIFHSNFGFLDLSGISEFACLAEAAARRRVLRIWSFGLPWRDIREHRERSSFYHILDLTGSQRSAKANEGLRCSF